MAAIQLTDDRARGVRYTVLSTINVTVEEAAMTHTYEELKGKTVAELREIAKDISHDAVQGSSQMNKEHLLPALCKALNIEMHEHHGVVGVDKPALKARIKMLKVERDHALEARDHGKLKMLRRQIHRINRDIKRHMA